MIKIKDYLDSHVLFEKEQIKLNNNFSIYCHQKIVFLSTQILWLSRRQDIKMITACKLHSGLDGIVKLDLDLNEFILR